jgi:hypothetical protein
MPARALLVEVPLEIEPPESTLWGYCAPGTKPAGCACNRPSRSPVGCSSGGRARALLVEVALN